LHGGQETLLALEEDLAAVLAEGVIAKGEREVRREELGGPAALAVEAMGVFVRL
jgi:hypothetical protein